MSNWSWAQIGGDGGSTSHDRKYADRRSRSLAPRIGSDHSDHYAEKASARDADRREAEGYRELTNVLRESDKRAEALKAFRADDPEPFPGTPDAPDFLERMAEHDAWTKRRDAHLQRAEGEELAARIFHR